MNLGLDLWLRPAPYHLLFPCLCFLTMYCLSFESSLNDKDKQPNPNKSSSGPKTSVKFRILFCGFKIWHCKIHFSLFMFTRVTFLLIYFNTIQIIAAITFKWQVLWISQLANLSTTPQRGWINQLTNEVMAYKWCKWIKLLVWVYLRVSARKKLCCTSS